jgi:hypothetical protein
VRRAFTLVDGVGSKEVLTPIKLFKVYHNGAYALFRRREIGSIEIGSYSFVVLTEIHSRYLRKECGIFRRMVQKIYSLTTQLWEGKWNIIELKVKENKYDREVSFFLQAGF